MPQLRSVVSLFHQYLYRREHATVQLFPALQSGRASPFRLYEVYVHDRSSILLQLYLSLRHAPHLR